MEDDDTKSQIPGGAAGATLGSWAELGGRNPLGPVLGCLLGVGGKGWI